MVIKTNSVPGWLAGWGMLLVFAVLVPALLLAGPVGAVDRYGAIAYSPSDGAAGWVTDGQTRDAAESGAMARCKAHGKACRDAVWVKNAWGALATASGGMHWGAEAGLTEAEAIEKALASCRSSGGKDCKVIQVICTLP